MSKKSAEIYEKCETQNVNFVQKIFWSMYGSAVFVFVFPTFFPISYMIFGYPKPQYWFLPFEQSFNIETPLSFYSIYLVQCFGVYFYITTVVSTMIIFLGFYLYIEACTLDYSTSLLRFDGDIRYAVTIKSAVQRSKKQLQINIALIEAIELHSEITR